MEDNMITEACVLIGGGIGALIGAAVSSTDKGKEINQNLTDALDNYEDRLSEYLPVDKIKDIIGGGN